MFLYVELYVTWILNRKTIKKYIRTKYHQILDINFLFTEKFNQVRCPKDACFHSVPCQIVNGVPECGPCPPGYIGDGRYCDKNVTTCIDNPCFEGEEIFSLKFFIHIRKHCKNKSDSFPNESIY